MVAVPSGRPHAIQLLSARARLVDSFIPLREDLLKATPAAAARRNGPQAGAH